MSKEEIEKDAKEVIKSADKSGHEKSFSDKVGDEMDKRKKEQDEKGAANSEQVPQIGEGKAQPSKGGAGKIDPLTGDPEIEVAEPGPLTDAELNQDPAELLEPDEKIPPAVPESTEGQAEKPDLGMVDDMKADADVWAGAKSIAGVEDNEEANKEQGKEDKKDSKQHPQNPGADADNVDSGKREKK